MNRAKYWLLATLFAVLSAGCADDYLSLLVVQNLAPDPMCLALAPSLDSPYISHGTADISAGGYFMTPMLQSSLVADPAAVNSKIIALTSVSVSIDPVASASSRALVIALGNMRGATRYISGPVPPGGLASVGFDAIDLDQAALMAGAIEPGKSVEIIANIVVHGKVEGSSVASPTFSYPITVTNGGASSFKVDLGACALFPTTFIGESHPSCYANPSQDGGFVECCTVDTALVCPAQGTMPVP